MREVVRRDRDDFELHRRQRSAKLGERGGVARRHHSDREARPGQLERQHAVLSHELARNHRHHRRLQIVVVHFDERDATSGVRLFRRSEQIGGTARRGRLAGLVLGHQLGERELHPIHGAHARELTGHLAQHRLGDGLHLADEPRGGVLRHPEDPRQFGGDQRRWTHASEHQADFSEGISRAERLDFTAVGQADAELSREDDAEAVARRAGGESRRAFRDVDGVHQRGSARDDRLVAALEQLAASEEWLELCVARRRRNLVRLSALAQVGPPIGRTGA